MAMHLVRQQRKPKKVALPQGYKRTPESKPVTENVEKAIEVFGAGRYDMILVAARRAYDLIRGDTPRVQVSDPHAPTALAMLEIEAGKVKPDYQSKFHRKRS